MSGEVSGWEVHITSYFSLPTDLAASFRDWPEFVGGDGYAVELRGGPGSVTTRLQDRQHEQDFVEVRGAGDRALFERVLGRVVYALADHSDEVWCRRLTKPRDSGT